MHTDESGELSFSEDPAVLERAIAMAGERAALERQRADRAEGRAATLLAASGVLAGFLAYFGAAVRRSDGPDLLVVAVFVAASAFLAKAAYFAVRATWTLKGYELTPDFALGLQHLPRLQGLQYELRWRVWECQQLQSVSVKRLFFLNRAQRNFVMGMALFFVVGALYLLAGWLCLSVPIWLVTLAAALLALGALLLDVLVERLGTFWTWTAPPTKKREAQAGSSNGEG